MSELKLSEEQQAQIAQAMKANKPYLLTIEEWVQTTKDGFIEFRVEVRSGRVEKMTRYSGNYWIREKEQEVTRNPL